jgi:hypothetical protein
MKNEINPVVFVVIGTWNFEGSEVRGVFTTLEVAEQFKKELVEICSYDEVNIEKWPVASSCSTPASFKP